VGEEVVEEVDNDLDVDLVVAVPEGDEGEDEGVLHLDLVQQDVLAARLYEAVEEQGARDGAEEEHVEEDEEEEEDLEPLRDGEGQQLVVGEGVVAAGDVHDEDHVPQARVVVGEAVRGGPLRHLDQHVAHQREDEDNHALEDDEDKELLVGRHQRLERTPHLAHEHDRQH
jgi:hypothetical protein